MHKLSIGRYNRLGRYHNGVLQCISRVERYLQGYHVHVHIPTNLEPQAERSCYCCTRRREFSQPPRRHSYVVTVAMGELPREFLFAENGRSNQSQNNWTTLAKRLTTGRAQGSMRVGSWAPWLTFMFSQVSFQSLQFNLHTLMCHILILHHSKQTFWENYLWALFLFE